MSVSGPIAGLAIQVAIGAWSAGTQVGLQGVVPRGARSQGAFPNAVAGGFEAYLKDRAVLGAGLDQGSLAVGFAVDLDGSTLAVGASGVKISDGGVGATQLASSAVSAAKIASNAVETAKVADNAITAPKLGFEARQDVFAPNGSTSAFDLAVEVPSEFFNFTLAYKNGLLQKKVASSPGDADEYTVSTAGGTTTITFDSTQFTFDSQVFTVYQGGISSSHNFGRFSWGQIGVSRGTNTKSFNFYGEEGYAGINTSGLVTRFNPLKFNNYVP